MLFVINEEGVTLFCRAIMIEEHFRRLRRSRSRLLKKVGGGNCPYVQGLWCRRGKNCYGPACDYARTVNAGMDDGCYGYVTGKTPQHKLREKLWRSKPASPLN